MMYSLCSCFQLNWDINFSSVLLVPSLDRVLSAFEVKGSFFPAQWPVLLYVKKLLIEVLTAHHLLWRRCFQEPACLYIMGSLFY